MRMEELKDDLLIVTPNHRKEEILKELYQQKQVYRIKFMTLEEVKRQFFFDYDLKAIVYLMKKYHYKIDVCLVYLKNMYYLEDKVYSSSKLNHLLALKKELEEEQLLFFHPLFIKYLAKREVRVTGYDRLDRFDRYMLSEIKKITQVVIDNQEEVEEKNLTVYAFDTMEQEIDYVVTSIIELSKQNIPLSSIKLTNLDQEYWSSIKRIFDFYQVPITLPKGSIYGTVVVQSFLDLLKKTNKIKDCWNKIEEMFPKEEETLTCLLTCCNQVVEFDEDPLIQIELLTYLLKNTSFPSSKEKMAIEVIPFSDLSSRDDQYVFVMGMNQNILPKLYKDEDYISDSLKEEVPLSLTSEKNHLEKEAVKNKLYSLSHGIITYKKASSFEEYYPSSLLSEMKVTIVENPPYAKYRYSHLSNKIKLAKKLDRFVKYQEKEDGLSALYQRYSTVPFQTYQNQFTGISKQDYLEFIHHSLLLSYTSMNEYNLCGFRYYLSRVLKVDSYEETFPIYVGNLYHKILSLAFLSQFDFETAFEIYQKERSLSVKEAFLLKKLKEELRDILKILKEQKELTALKEALYEKEITLPIDANIKARFKGMIDKILYKEMLGETYVALIDYKSGSFSTSISNMIYGIDMQLPIYLYLMKHSKLFKNPKVTGFYFQKILHPEVTRKQGNSVMDQKRERMKLQGYSLDQESVVELFDESYQNSEMIKGMKVTSKGFAHYTKIVSEEDIEAILALTKEKIESSAHNIIEANFVINPKKIGKENVSCLYCPYQDICYHTEKDLVYLKEYHGLDFLGGEV